jgi:hypothetical protein
VREHTDKGKERDKSGNFRQPTKEKRSLRFGATTRETTGKRLGRPPENPRKAPQPPGERPHRQHPDLGNDRTRLARRPLRETPAISSPKASAPLPVRDNRTDRTAPIRAPQQPHLHPHRDMCRCTGAPQPPGEHPHRQHPDLGNDRTRLARRPTAAPGAPTSTVPCRSPRAPHQCSVIYFR